MTSTLPTVWIMRTRDGWYPVQPSDQCKPEDHGRLNPHVVEIRDISGNILWSQSADFQKDPPGTIYPPRGVEDISAYDQDQVVAGYLDQQPDDPVSGENSPPAFRWGATNRIRDRQVADDGFDNLRRAYLAMRRGLH